MKTLRFIRQRVASRLLTWALYIFPVDSAEREAIARGLREQREYARYQAYSLAEGGSPRTFEEWSVFARKWSWL
jgi:hypothetical protein